VYIIDSTGEDLLLRYPDYANMHSTYSDFHEMPAGSFAGTVIYSENSRIVLYWSMDAGPTGDQPKIVKGNFCMKKKTVILQRTKLDLRCSTQLNKKAVRFFSQQPP
jgi:hypothetical protein